MIEELDVRGFGRLHGRFRPGPELTVVLGGNEAGKSSLHAALVRALFGFSRRERRLHAGESVLTRTAPWNGAPHAVHATVRARGRRLRIEWDFARYSVRLLDADTGADLSAEIAGPRSEVELGPYLFGIGLTEFRQVCCLDQAAIDAVRHSEELTVSLRHAVETGAADGGVGSAVEILDAVLRYDIGVRVDTLTAKAGGRLDRRREDADRLAAELERSRAAREEVRALAARLADVERRRDDARGAFLLVEQELLRARAHELHERLGRARAQRLAEPAEPAPPADLPTGMEGRVRAALGAVESETAATAALAAEDQAAPLRAPDPLLARYRSERVRLAGLHAGVRDRGRSRGLALAAAVALAAVTAGVLVHPAALLGLVAAVVIAVLAGRRGAEGEGLSQALEPYGADSIAELDERVASEDRELGAARARARALEAARERVRRSEGGLLDLLASIGMEAETRAEAVDRFEARVAASAAARAARGRHEQASVALETALGDRTVDELAAEARAALGRVREHVATHGQRASTEPAAGRPTDEADLEGTVELRRAELSGLEHEANRVASRVAEREAHLPEVAIVREELDEARADADRLTEAAEAVRLARVTLEAGAREAHRTFAPHLNRALSANLLRITGGRYNEAAVGDDLSIRVVAPETGRLVPVSLLSRGTRDQIHLVERLEIARLLDTSGGRAPMLLDEPFVHFDGRRLDHALALVAEEAERRQVVLFTTDPGLAERVRDRAGRCATIELEAPGLEEDGQPQRGRASVISPDTASIATPTRSSPARSAFGAAIARADPSSRGSSTRPPSSTLSSAITPPGRVRR